MARKETSCVLFKSQSSQTVDEEGERKQPESTPPSQNSGWNHRNLLSLGLYSCYIMEVNKPGLLFGDLFYSQLC